MRSFIKRVTSAVVAGAVVLGSIAFYPDAKKNVVNAAETKYDSANLVNYATIMGRAVDYGIVSQSITQSQHMETTFATFSYARTIDTTTDVDLTNAETAQFIIGEITSTGDFGTLKFGHVRTSTGQVYVENMRITMSDTMNPRDSFRFQDDVATTTHFNYSYLKRHEIQESIDTVIDHARDESEEMVIRTGDHDYVLDSTDDSLVSVNGAVTTININDERYENKVVYINLDDPKFATLLSYWASEPNGHHLDINKRSSTVIVFTSAKTEPITLGKVSVYAPDSPLYASAPSEGIHDYDYYSSVTTYSGNQSTHNAYVDKEIAQKLIWNITGSKNITISSNAGTFLCLAGDKAHKDVKVTLDGNPCAGWLVVNGNVENKCEYHYIYGGNSEEQQTEGEGQMHFVARKGFATKYADKDNISTYVDNSVDFDAGDYQFFWQEYTDETFNTPVGERSTVKIKDTSYVDFPTLTFTADDSSDPHYVTETPKDFYFRITEDPSKSLDGVKNSAGYINIRLRAFVERKGPDRTEIKFRVQSVTMIGENESSLIQYDKNGKWGAEPDREWVDVVNARFDLGAFFNRVKVPGYMTLTKTIKGDVTEEDRQGLTFTVTDGADFTVEYKLGRDFTKNDSGVYELTTPLTLPDSETKYTVTETLYSLDGYKLEEVCYKVDGGETQHDNDTAVLDSVSTDSDNPTTVAYTDSYTPLGNLKVLKTAVDNNNNNINYYYEFTVKNSDDQYLQADKQTFDATEYYFTIGTNEEQTFENIPVGLYTITENTDLFVYGYTFEKVSSKTYGTADVTKKSTVEFKLENKFTQDLGNLEVTKTAKDNNGNAVEGTFKFTIGTPMRGFLQADGTFGNKKHYFTISTGQTLTFENLPADNYMITEDTESISVTGYTFNMDASKYSVLGIVTKNGNTNVKLENDFTQDVGTLRVNKTAQDNHDTNVSGTFEFSVRNSKGQFLQADKTSFDTTEVFFTVEAGSHTDFENLPVGKYTVTEKTSSISVEGYTFTSTGSTTSYEATVTKGETSDAQLVNKFIQDLGTLTVAKVAKDNNDKDVEGSFLFSVKNSAGKFLQSDEETFTDTEYFFTVAAGSSKTFTDLPVGTYTISEKTDALSVPGYTYTSTGSTVTGNGVVSKTSTADSTVTLTNRYIQDVGSLTVKKTATDNNNENVTGYFNFSVMNSKGEYLQSDKKSFDTDEFFFTVAAGSTAVFEDLPVGEYTVTEDKDSIFIAGYTFRENDSTTFDVKTVAKGRNVDAELINKFTKDVGKLAVKKTALDDNNDTVSGSFQFSVKNESHQYLQADEKTFGDTEIFFTIATSETKVFKDLPVGVYTVTENKNAVNVDGYTFVDSSQTSDDAMIYKDQTATAGLNNRYTKDIGSLTVEKSAIDNYNNTVSGSFKFSVKNSDGQYLQADGKTFEDEAYFFTVAAGSSKTFEKLPVGAYAVEEDTDSVSVDGYTFNKNDSKTSDNADVVKDENAEAKLENKFTLDLGSLKITKALGEGYPEEAGTKAYNFIINGPDDYSEMRTVTGADSVIITGLKPGKYTVTEDTNDAKIEGYDLEVTGGGEVTVVGKAEAATTITNTYTLQTGSLKITKALGAGAPNGADATEYEFTVTGPNNYSDSFKLKAGDSKTLEDLVPGTYTVTENKTAAAIDGYDLEVTGDGEVAVAAKAEATTTVTNTYKQQLGSLTINKVLGDNAPDSAKNKTYSFIVTGPDNFNKTYEIEGEGSRTIENLVPGSYTVTEVENGAAIADYDLEVTGGGTVTVAAKTIAETTITNTYTEQPGSLKITKALGANAPEAASTKTYYFKVTGPDNFNETYPIEGAGSKTINGLKPGTYTVFEVLDGIAIEGYDIEITGGGEVTVASNKVAETTITNTYTQQKGKLTVAKALGTGAPDAANEIEYEFTVTGPGNYSEGFKLKAGESKTLEDLVPGTYTVTENKTGAAIDGFDLEVTGDGEVTVEANATAEATVTNTYKQQLGSLKVTKALGAGAPDGANAIEYEFTVTGPNNYSNSFKLKAGEYKLIEDLVPGTYTVTENKTNAAIDGYDLEVTGDGEVTVVAKATALATVTNTFTQQKGKLTIYKELGANAPAAANGTEYEFTITGPGNFSDSIKIKAGESGTLTGLVPGKYTVTEVENSAVIANYDLEVTGEGTVDVASNDEAEITITNTYTQQKGSLSVTKTAKDNNNDAVSGTFYFSVKNADGKFLQADEKSFDTTEVFFSVTAGSSKEFSDLPVGEYTVSEDTTRVEVVGYDYLSTGNTTTTTANVTKSATPATAGLVNNYEKHLGTLTVQKTAKDNNNDDVTGTFEFSVKDGEGKYLQSDEKTFADAEYLFSVAAGSSKTFENLPAGKYDVTEKTTDISVSGYTFVENGSTTSGTGTVSKTSTEHSTVELINKFTKDVGSLKITKTLGANAPQGADQKTYVFNVTGPDGYDKNFEIDGAGSKTITDLVPGNYTVTEKKDGAAIDGYDLEVTGDDGKTVEVKVDEVSSVTITNTYTQQKGKLTVAKALGTGAPDAAKEIEYDFTVTGPGNYSEGFKLKAGESKTLEDLVPGTYTVTENKTGAAIDGFDLEVTGDGEVTVEANATAEATVTNTYKQQLGSLKVTKALGAGAPDGANAIEYEFTVTGPNNYSNSFKLKAGEYKLIEDLVPGKYTVTENKTDAAIDGYDLEVTGDGEVKVEGNSTAIITVTNTYTQQKGKLTVAKALGTGAPDAAKEIEYDFTVTGPGNYSEGFKLKAGESKTLEDLVPGTYTVTENKTGAAIDGFDLEVTGDGEVTVEANATAEATVTNTYKQQLGSLKVTKALGAGAPDGANAIEYEFTVTGPNNYSNSFKLKAGEYKLIEDLVPGTYTVTENKTNAKIDGYDLEVTGDGEVTVVAKATALATVTNTYEDNSSSTKGKLTITKVLGDGAPTAASEVEYEFTITGPNGYSDTKKIKGAGSETIENLEPGNYTVTENKDGAKIANYDLTVTGDDGKTIEVKAGETAEAKITNTYEDNTSSTKGKLTITKALGDGAPTAASEVEYEFTITGPNGYSDTKKIKGAGSETIENLEPGNYTVTENKDGAKIANYDLTVTGDDGKTIEVKAGETAEAKITNTYEDNTSSTKGKLTITKALADGAPDDAKSMEFKFIITGPDDYSDEITIIGAESRTITDLEPGNYTVTEDKESAKITNYDLTVSGDDGKTIEVKAGETAEVKIINTYEDNTSSNKGSLKVIKTIAAGAPDEAYETVFAFTVTGIGYSETKFVEGEGYAIFDNLEPGRYTVTENKDAAKITNYELTVTGDEGEAVEVKAGETTEARITNTYKDSTAPSTGKLKISKTLGAGYPDAATGTTYTFTITGPNNFSTTRTIKGSGSVTVEGLEPGKYTVTEDKDGAKITNYDLTVTGDDGKEIEVKAGEIANAAITNTYKDSTTPDTGKLKITKALGAGAPSDANIKNYEFTVTGPDNFNKSYEIKGAGYLIIEDLKPGNYTVTEDKASANITNYDLTVTGGGTVEVKAGKTAETTITNTYKDNSSTVDTGSLTVKKTAKDGSGNDVTGSFKFSVKNSEGKYLQQNEKDFDTSIYLFTINAGETKKFTGLPVGRYTVEEDISDMTVTGNYEFVVADSTYSVEKNVSKDADIEAELINYFKEGGAPTPAPTGAITVTKKNAGVTSVAASSYTFYVKCGDQYVQDDSTGALGSDKHEFTVDPSSSEGTTITGLTLGKTYVIEEASVSVPSGYTCATTYTESNTVVLDKENKTGSVKITNTFIDTSKPDGGSGSGTGMLKITKKVTGSTASTGMPAEYRFTVSYIDGDDTLYVQDTAGTTGSEKHEFAVSANSSVVITGLALDVEYKVEEVKVTGIPSDYSCKVSYTDGGTVTLDSSSDSATVVITNNYSYKAQEPAPTTGSLTITKGLNSGAPSDAKNKTYTFKVTGNGTTQTVTIKGANSKTIHDLVPGNYTVSEERDGISIAKYSVTVSGEGNVEIVAGETAKIKITNTYEDITGSLTVNKALVSGAPDAAKDKEYVFTVSGPDGYSETVKIKGAKSATLTGLIPGSYKVTENESAAAIDGYDLTVTGENNTSVSVQSKKNTSVTITNTYVHKMGTLCFTKTFGGDVTESEANGGDLYFIIENTDTSLTERYLKADGTFTANKDEAHITLADLEKTPATNGKFAFKKNFTVPVGNYKVTEENTNVYFRGTSTPITCASSSVTSSVADVNDGTTSDVELSDVYELDDNLKVTFNKEDEAQHLIADAELTLTSLDGYDLSSVIVTQDGKQVTVKLSADKSSISFSTVDTAPSIVSGLKAGDYELKETVTPVKYKTADAIKFTLYPDGNTKRVGDVTVSGSPIVMVDKADPNYHQGGNNPPIPATGETTSAMTMIGATLMILAAACFTGLYLIRRKKKAE